MKAKKWIAKEEKYTDIDIDDECSAYEDDMEKMIKCPHCNKYVMYGETYTSRDIYTHPSGIFGFAVCSECYQKEWEKELKR